MSENFLELNESNFSKETQTGVILVDFFAKWCGPCKMLAPVLEEVAGNLDGKAKIGKIDIDKEIKLATQFQVTSVPTLVLFKDGKEIDRIIGLRDAKALEDFIKKAV